MRKQSGFTLVELMVTAVIGLFLMASLMNLFITTNRSVSLSDALAQNQESGRFALDYITRFARKAGYTSDFKSYAPPILTEKGLQDAGQVACLAGACSSNNPGDVNGDRISIPYITDASGINRSCSGAIIGDNQSISNVFWVSNSADSEFDLQCRTYDYSTGAWIDASPVSIVTNVESLEFLVGIAATASDRGVSRYINIATLEDPGSSISLNQVRSIRIALLTTSQNELDKKKISTNVETREFNILDGQTISISDGNLRQIFSNTIELPNMIEGSVFN